MGHSEPELRPVASGDVVAANKASHPRVSLRNGLCANSLFRDAAQFGIYGSRRETFQRALLAAAKFRLNQRFPGYEVLQEVGRGGMGVIYRAREVGSGRIVALKCLLHADESSDALIARFRREAETATSLSHPNIVPVYRCGETADGLPFFAMKFAWRGSLHQAQDEYRTDRRKSVRLMRDVALAVQYAHTNGVLHRDIKPSNILLDANDEPLVSDFGLARSFNDSSHLTRTLAVVGTLAYMAPEQLTRAPAMAASDIYSLGAVLFELLAGRAPFSGADSLAAARDRREVPNLRAIAKHLDRDLVTICSHCLEPIPANRYKSCDALASDLQNWLDGEAISIRRVGLPTRFGRRFRTDRKWAATVCVGFVSLCALVGWQLHMANVQVTVRDKVLAEHSVGVTPFVNLDELNIEPGFGKFLADSLLRELTALGPATVHSLPSIAAVTTGAEETVQKSGRLPKTRTVLTGTLRTAAGKQRITVRLLDSAAGEPLLVRTWEGDDRIETASDFAKTLAGPIYKILDSADWSNLIASRSDTGLQNQSAREAILAGRELMTRYTLHDLDRAISLFEKAVQIAPKSSIARAYLSSAATARTHYVADWSYLTLGKESAMKAIQLSPMSGEALGALAGADYQSGKFGEALEEGLKRIETAGMQEQSTRFMGAVFDTMGRPDRALAWFALASQLSGTRGYVDPLMGDCWVKIGDDTAALKAYTRSMELHPERSEGAVGMCHMRMLQGDFAAARELYGRELSGREDFGDAKAIAAQVEFFARNFEAAEKLYADLVATDEDGGGTFYGAVSYLSALGRAKIATGNPHEAEELLKRCLDRETASLKRQPQNAEALYRLAAIECSLGRVRQSLNHLRAAVHLGWIDYRSLALDPRFDALRQEKAYQTFLNDLSALAAGMKSKITNNLWRNEQWMPKIGMN